MTFREEAHLVSREIFNLKHLPLVAGDDIIHSIPRACLVSPKHDVLQDDTLRYKKRMEDQGVPVAWCHIKSGFHRAINTVTLVGFLPYAEKIRNAAAGFITNLWMVFPFTKAKNGGSPFMMASKYLLLWLEGAQADSCCWWKKKTNGSHLLAASVDNNPEDREIVIVNSSVRALLLKQWSLGQQRHRCPEAC